MNCQHCDSSIQNARRGLCRDCYNSKEIRQMYRRDGTPVEVDIEPTAEEVDATVREESKRLPEWWDLDVAMMAQGVMDE